MNQYIPTHCLMPQLNSHTLNIILSILRLAFITNCLQVQQFELPVSEYQHGLMETNLQIQDKQAKIQVLLESEELHICCKPTTTIFQKAYYFLSNPFFQVYDYPCSQKGYSSASFSLNKLGPLELNFKEMEFPECKRGSLGLSKKSYFLSKLPQEHQIFTIEPNSKSTSSLDRYTLVFGKNDSFHTFTCTSSELWELEVQQLHINDAPIQAKILQFATAHSYLAIPKDTYKYLMEMLKNQYQCILQDTHIFCPCEMGDPTQYPTMSLHLRDDLVLQIKPENYMQRQEEICEALVIQSEGNMWVVNPLIFKDYIFQFDHFQNQIGLKMIPKFQPQNEQTIKLPTQLILNCLVILLMCVFVALVIIELVKRFSGLADCQEETFRDYMRRNQ